MAQWAQCLTVGSGLVFVQPAEAATSSDWIFELGVTIYVGAPSVVEAAVSRLRAQPELAGRCALRIVFTDPSVARELMTFLPDLDVRAMYGMTEALGVNVTPPGMALTRPGSLGLPFGGAEVQILGENGSRLPPLTEGEIVIRSPLLIESYLDASAADSAVFGKGWFHTGDLGRIDPDGYLYLTGRIKEQISRGGAKVNPVEVDEVLKADPDVADAGTFSFAHRTLGEEVAAAVVLRPRATATEASLRDRAIEQLAPHKVPRRIVFVDSIPRQLGKVQRRTLAEMVGLGPRRTPPTDSELPSGRVEQTVAEIWERLLCLDVPVARSDDFFELGGDSLLATEMLLELEEQLGAPVGQSALLRGARLDELAKAADGGRRPPASPSEMVITVQPGGSLPPLFWVHDVLEAANISFHLGSNRPVYAIQRRSVDSPQPAGTGVDEIVGSYVSAVLEQRPEGQYIIGGHSAAGVVAFEVASSLERIGHQAALLVLCDSAPPFSLFTRIQRLRYSVTTTATYVLRANWRERRASLARFAARQATRLPRLGARLAEPPNRWAPNVKSSDPEIMLMKSLMIDPRPTGTYSGRTLFLRAKRGLGQRYAEYWRELITGPLAMEEVDGDHLTCLREPNAGPLVRVMREHLVRTAGSS
jgi:thioesterase domain-containing protein/acyl carrier protein